MKQVSFIALAFIAVLAYLSLIIVHQGTEAVSYGVSHSQKAPLILKPGLHFKIPLLQRTRVINLQQQLFSADGSTDQPYLSVQTFDKQNLELGYDVLWQVVDAKKFYLAQLDKPTLNSMREALDNAITSTVAQLTLVQLLDGEQRQTLLAGVQAKLQDSFADAGIKINAIHLNDINVPAAERSVWLERMGSQQQGQLAQLQLQTSTLAQTLKANVDTKIATILTQGQQQANEIRAEANAKATEIYNQAYQKDPDFYKFYHDLEAYEETIGKQDVLVFSTDNPFFKSLAPNRTKP